MLTDKRLLAVLAHPDDESFGPGGTLAKYARLGAEVHIAIATDGVAGSVVDEYADQRANLAHIREQELRAAVRILGAQLHMLDYRDSGYIGDPANEHPEAFIQVDKTESTGRVVALIRQIRPQIVITHDETGGYYHPDHIRCHEITKAAFYAAADAARYPEIGPAPFQAQRLYYTVIPDRWLRLFTWAMRLRGEDPTQVGRNRDIDLTKLGRPESDVHAHIDIRPTWEVKRAASAEHKSQGGGAGFGRRLPQWLQKQLFGAEHFMRAYPPAPSGYQDKSLFPA